MNRKIGIVGENSAEYVKALLNIWEAGDCAVLLDWRLPPGQVLEMLSLSGAQECYIDRRFESQDLQNSSLYIHWMESPAGQSVSLSPDDFRDFRFPTSDEDAVILFSSGTTGKSKGIVLYFRALYENSEAVAEYLQPNPNDCFYLVKALSHSSTLVGELLVALRFSARVILAATVLPPRVALHSICEEKATILCVNPVLLELFARTQERLHFPLPLRVIYTSGAVADRALMLRAREIFAPIPVLNVYGLSEAGPRVSAQRINGYHTPGSVGVPVRGVSVEIRRENGTRCTWGEQGVLFVKTPSALSRYLGAPSPCRDGWINTGDIGVLDETGELFVRGRADDVIVQGAHNLDPNGIEAVLKECPGVEKCMVFGVPDSQYGQRALCIYVAKENFTQRLYRYARERLADYEIPKGFLRVPAIPVTVTGKRSRALARSQYLAAKEDKLHE